MDHRLCKLIKANRYRLSGRAMSHELPGSGMSRAATGACHLRSGVSHGGPTKERRCPTVTSSRSQYRGRLQFLRVQTH